MVLPRTSFSICVRDGSSFLGFVFFSLHVHVHGFSILEAMTSVSVYPGDEFDEDSEALSYTEYDEHREFAAHFGVEKSDDESPGIDLVQLPCQSVASTASGSPSSSSANTPTKLPIKASSDTPSPESATTNASTPSPSASMPRRDLDGYKRRRMVGKQKDPHSCASDHTVDGFALHMHPACKKYLHSKTGDRSLIRKRVLQTKYRLLVELKTLGSIKIDDNVPIQWIRGEENERQAQDTLDEQYFWKVARDRDKCIEDRGYAMNWLDQKVKSMAGTIGPSQQEMRIQGVPTVLLTYQDGSLVIDPKTVQLPANWVRSGESSTLEQLKSCSLSDVLQLLRDHPTVLKLRARLLDLAVRTCNTIHTSKYSFSIELCTKSWQEQSALRVHAHLWLQLKMRTLQIKDAVIGGSTPFINWACLSYMAGASSRSLAASMAGSFYCCVQKLSTLVSETTTLPWIDYPVKDTWITSLYAGNKISAEVAKAGYLKSVYRAQHNIAQLEFIEAGRKKVAQQTAWEQNEALLRSQQKPWKVLPRVQQWRAQYSEIRSRYKFLVLDGPSSTGKTRYALDQYGIGQMLYSDCSMGIPNLRSFDADKHRAILFDELSPKAALTLKKCLQAGNDTVQLGASPTMVHAYSLHVFKVEMVICCNNWQEELTTLSASEVEWLTTNCFYCAVDGPLWVEEPIGGESFTPPEVEFIDGAMSVPESSRPVQLGCHLRDSSLGIPHEKQRSLI